ncbi:LmbE family protein [Paludibacter propionicigenes WB4]|uniref:LmbE family protein n=1 Tax=Paludibacter propionicigenes (strain DSM 17365 / JCM 13257 / WB4) TaxID=694427 RepID=E4T308_PALPW|nr:PIG-L deacetylase family protein [Paludibacter propionicigenes]ADQ79102.1 LmbE family protein [Paludibacter propionicigenes WB4]
MSNILIIAPHPDDEILGCGAVMRKHVLEGDDVYVIIMTNAHVGDPELYKEEVVASVRSEALEAHELLGVKKTIFFDFPAPALDQFPKYKMSAKVSATISEYNIQTVYIPWRGDIHIDHKVVYDISLVACRPVGDYSVTRILAYETLSETEWCSPFGSEAFIPNVFVSVTFDEFTSKIDAMKCYKSQLRDFPASRSIESLISLSKLRGSTINKQRAEAFMLIRNIVV